MLLLTELEVIHGVVRIPRWDTSAHHNTAEQNRATDCSENPTAPSPCLGVRHYFSLSVVRQRARICWRDDQTYFDKSARLVRLRFILRALRHRVTWTRVKSELFKAGGAWLVCFALLFLVVNDIKKFSGKKLSRLQSCFALIYWRFVGDNLGWTFTRNGCPLRLA